jgi:hypothetical protein
MFRTIRITILLAILAYVSIGSWVTRAQSTAWEQPLQVVVYPINADRSVRSATYIRTLNNETFQPIAQFLQREGERYGVAVDKPIEVHLAKEIDAIPPQAPRSGNPFEAMYWSLQFRVWAWMNDDVEGVRPQVRMFVQYHDPYSEEFVAHSVGLEKGLIGLVQAFADPAQNDQNNVVIAHEMLHTVGATDKYDPGTNHPYFPDGYADPGLKPVLPQKEAEIMGGRIPQTDRAAIVPENLAQVLIGEKTAREINWLRD